MNILKLFTKSGRQSIVKEVLDENLTEELVYSQISTTATAILAKADIPEDKASSVNGYVSQGADIVTAVVAATADGKITPEEARDVIGKVFAVCKTTLPDVLAKVKDLITSKVP